MFQGVRSPEDFAAVLGVPDDAIALVIQKDNLCRAKNCRFNAIESKRGFCPAHQRSWYPLENSRGCDLYGPEFMRNNGKFRVYDCSAKSCLSAGYFPSQDVIYIPTAGHEMVLNTPNLVSADMKKKLREKNFKSGIYLYPWHFSPEY